ncbi:MAG: A/G-specific adenine glycosylase [Planctomycetes bacterium]|nr:A/G-specific adenine glycosylase [Planctomycetota bacterium]
MPTPLAPRARARLLRWFRAERRALPWRERRDAYRVWISEAMLQQTRVATVIPYFERFLARFPDVEALAAAREEDVLAHWSGLGYYRRARTLHQAARSIVAELGGVFPSTRTGLLELPGIGPYTAGAIASLAFDAPEALVDGNVERVFARLFALPGALGSSSLKERAWELARELVPRAKGAGEWNEALMELGALVCLPREPRCGLCPWEADCAARALGRAAEFPAPKARKPGLEVELEALLVERSGRILLHQRAAHEGRMALMWELPTRELGSEHLFSAHWPLQAGRVLLREGEELGRLRHTITHHRIQVVLRRGELAAQPRGAGWCWATAGDASGLALTGMTRKALRGRCASPLSRA